MGKYKASLPENIDITVDTAVRGDESPSAADIYMNDLLSTVHNLELSLPFGYEQELDEAIARLTKIYARIDKPF